MARDAFTSGVHVVGVVSAIFYAGLAVLAVRAFRHVRTSHGGDDTANKDQWTDPAPKGRVDHRDTKPAHMAKARA